MGDQTCLQHSVMMEWYSSIVHRKGKSAILWCPTLAQPSTLLTVTMTEESFLRGSNIIVSAYFMFLWWTNFHVTRNKHEKVTSVAAWFVNWLNAYKVLYYVKCYLYCVQFCYLYFTLQYFQLFCFYSTSQNQNYLKMFYLITLQI